MTKSTTVPKIARAVRRRTMLQLDMGLLNVGDRLAPIRRSVVCHRSGSASPVS